MKLIRMLLGLATLLVVAAAYSQTSQDAVKLLNRVSGTYQGLRNYKITGVNVAEERRGDYYSLTETPFTMAEVKPGKFRFELSGPTFGASLLVSDGVKTSQYVGMRRQYTVQPATTAIPVELPSPFKPPDYVNRYSHLADNTNSAAWLREEDLPVLGKNIHCAVVQVVLKTDSADSKNVVLPHIFWIDESGFTVLKESWDQPHQDDDGAYVVHKSILYRVIQTAGPVEDSLFVFAPPKIAREVDQLTLPWDSKGVSPSKLTGKEAPEFVAVSTTGEKISLKSLQGKVVLLDFWATWCEPCRVSEPMMHRLSEKFKDKGLVVLGINFGEESGAVNGYIKHNSSPFSTYLDEERKIAKSYGVNSVPAFILISKEGKVTDIEDGFDEKTKESKLEAALKNAGIE